MTTRILVVDDSATIRKVVTGLLERHGYEAVAAADGQQALALLAESVRREPAKANGPEPPKVNEKSGATALRGMGTAAAAGGAAGSASKGGAKGDPGRGFDLVLLDFVMPRMNGFQFCRALRANEALRATPVILMSAKSDKIREQFVLQTGAIDAISKPFDATALVAVIENAVNRSATWRARGEALAAGIPDDFDTESVRAPTSSMVDSDSRRVRVAHELVTRIASVVSPIVARLPAGAAADEQQIVNALMNDLTPDALRDVAEMLRSTDLHAIGKVSLAGDLAYIPIGAVLQLLQIENQTGVLSVTSGKSEVFIAMRVGLIDLVQSRGAGQEFRLGRYFVENGIVTPEQIELLLKGRASTPAPPLPPGGASASAKTKSGEHAAARASRPPSPSASAFGRREESTHTRNVRVLGEMLIETGQVTKEQLKDALARQSSELTYEVLRWQKGRFEFRREPPSALAASAELGLPVASVVMEGFRRVDEWRVVETGLGSFDAILQRDMVSLDQLGKDRLARQEKIVLDAVDGERNVREIVAACHMSSFDACKILFQLLEARLVRRRARPSLHGEEASPGAE